MKRLSRVPRGLTPGVVAVAMFCLGASPTLLPADGPIAPAALVSQMGVGIDCQWSEVDSRIANYSTQELIDFRNKGFQHFRLRVNKRPASLLWPFLDAQIQDCLNNGGIPIVAYQSATFEDDPSAQNQADWVQWWADVATHYKDYSHRLMFDLMVEIAASSSLSEAPIHQLNEAYI